MDVLRPQLKMLHEYLDGEFTKLYSYRFDCFVIKPVNEGGYQRSANEDALHDMMLDFIGYGLPGNEFLSYGDDASYPFDDKVSPFHRPPRNYNHFAGTYGLQQPCTDAIPANENNASFPNAEKKSKALDIVHPVTGEKLQFSAK